MSRQPAWHWTDRNHPRRTVCGRHLRHLCVARKFDDVTCHWCRKDLPPVRDADRLWPGPCEMIVTGGFGLELCGKYLCREHSPHMLKAVKVTNEPVAPDVDARLK